ncbi:MAG: Bcr/CflA family efflux MFS transporter [Coriobacteriales bacterium]|jgi:DHA1 family bicyclomycin/chloramphenicol resistance-like MFS transporter
MTTSENSTKSIQPERETGSAQSAGEKHPDSATGWLALPQPRLKTIGLVVLLGAINAICPLALDMYTPAVPDMPAYFSTSEAMVNLTIAGFYLFFAVGLLVFGPVSDRYGRKPILVGGVLVFVVGSCLCAVSLSITALIVFRVIQAIGAGAACAVSTAIIKDCFREERRTQLLSVLQVLMVVGPVFAPLIGGFILMFSDWRMIFWVIAIVGAVCLVISLAFAESLSPDKRVKGGIGESLSRMAAVGKNRGFACLLLMVSLFSIPYMAYVAIASYVYVDFFGTTQQVYSYFFAFTAAVSAFGPAIYLKLSKWVTKRQFTYGVLVVCLGVAVCLILPLGSLSALAFCGIFTIFILAEAAIRPYGTDVLLSMQDEDAGSASSLINFLTNFLGVIGMGIIPLFEGDYIFGLGVIMAGSMAAALALWLYILRSKKISIWQFER